MPVVIRLVLDRRECPLLADSSLLQSVLDMAVCFRPRAIAILFDGLGPLRGLEASHE